MSSPPADDPLRRSLGAAATRLGLDLDVAQIDALLGYLALLQRWNAVYNLTAVRDPAEMLRLHLADCMAVAPALHRERGHGAFRLLDVGSGGGLPGVVIAILMPKVQVTCVDTVGKKAAFVQQVAGELRLTNLRARHARVETLRDEVFDVVASRAFASLTDFIGCTDGLVAPDGCWMAMKGRRPDDEIAALAGRPLVFHVEPLHVPDLDAERHLVWIRRG